MKPYLSNDEYKLYTLIYNRAVASLMSDAEVEDTKVNILANDCLFNLEGEKVVFDGFLKIYEEAKIDETEDFKSSNPINKINIEIIKPEIYSIRPWPKGCSGSGFFEESLNPKI